MLTGGFLRQQWPKWHEHLVEECEALHVNDVLWPIQPSLLATRWEWTIPGPLTGWRDAQLRWLCCAPGKKHRQECCGDAEGDPLPGSRRQPDRKQPCCKARSILRRSA